MANINNLTNVGGETHASALDITSYERKALYFAKANFVLAPLADEQAGGDYGDNWQWYRYGRYTASRTALGEADTTATGLDMSFTTVTATAAQYGRLLKFTKLLKRRGLDANLDGAMEPFGELWGDTWNLLANDAMAGYGGTGGVTKRYSDATNTVAGNANLSSLAAGDVMSTWEINQAVKTLRINRTRPWNNKGFVGVLDPVTEMWLQQDSKYVQINQHQNAALFHEGYVGMWGGVYFLSQDQYTFTGGTTHWFGDTTGVTDYVTTGLTVQVSYILGKHAFGKVSLKEMQNRMIVIDTPDSGNVFGNIIYLAFNFWTVFPILNSAFAVAVYSTSA